MSTFELCLVFFFSSRRRHTRLQGDWSSDVCSSDLLYSMQAGAPLTVYFHGGGFVIGDLDTHDEPCRMLCRHSGSHVLSVAYRLAPEHPYPAAVKNPLAPVPWARPKPASPGAHPSPLAVGGG